MEAETANVLTGLLPVVVGGALTLLGSTISPLALQWLSSRQAEGRLRRERFEEMLSAVYAHDHWVERMREAHMLGSKEDETASPLNRALLIAAIYFPDMHKELQLLDTATTKYILWMIDAKQKRINGDMSGMSKGFQPIYQQYRVSFIGFHDKATAYARDRGGKV